MKPIVRNSVYPLIIIAFTGIACAFYWSFLVDAQRVEMEAARHRGELHVQQINEAVDQQLDATLRSVDTVIRHLRTIYVHDRKEFDRSVRDTLAAYPKGMLQFVTVFGPDGYLDYSSDTTPGFKPKRIYFGDREHFQIHAGSNQDNLFISKPIIGRIAGIPLIQITRPIWDGKRFAGVIGVPLRPEYIANNLWSLHIDPNDMISIVREDGRIIARSRKLEEGLKLTTPPDRPFMHSHSGEHGIFRNTSITDKIPLLFSWRHLTNYPIIAVTAIDEEEELKGISDQQSDARNRTLLGMVLVITFSVWISVLVSRVNRKNNDLSQSEHRYRSLIDHNNAIILQVDPNSGKILGANQSACNFYGWSNEELCSKSIQAINQLSPEQVETERQAAAREDRRYFIFPHRLANGDTRIVEVHSTPVTDGYRTILISIIHDITQRVQNEKEIDSLLQEQNAILHSRIVGIVKLKDRKFIWTNSTFAEMLGYTKDEMIGQSTRITYPSDEAYSAFDQTAYPVLHRCEIFRTEIQYQHKNGTLRWFEINGSLISPGSEESIWAFVDITERKQAEELLRKLSTAVEQSPASVVITNLEGNIEYVNPRFVETTGYSSDEIIGKNPRILQSGQTPNEVYRDLWDKLTHGFVWNGELINKRKNGELYWEETHISPVKNPSGLITHYVAVKIDVTERKKVDAERNRLLKIIEEAPDFIAMSDMDAHITYLNPAGARMVGFPENVDWSLLEIKDFHPEWAIRRVMEEAIPDVLVHGSWQGESALQHRNGRVTPVLQALLLHRDQSGNPEYLSTIMRDITEIKRAESDLRIAATAFEAQEGMSITDEKGIIIRVNRAFTNITGYTADEAIGKTNKLMKSGRHDANFYTAMWESINKTGLWEGEIWNRRKNGEVYPEHLTITAVKNVDGVVTNYVSTLTDITLTKAAEDEIKHLAFYDPLTRLPNRRLLLDRLRQALASTARSGCAGALLFIDLDNFKTLNDTLGHDIGDLLLEQVAKRLESCVREGDTVARLGGDEFVIMLEDLSKSSIEAAEQTELVGHKILSMLNQPYQLASHEYNNTPSIGATLFSDNSLSVDDLMRQADIAMYQSKKAGRNTIRFFDPQMQETIDTRATLERELRNALENQQFQLYYQLQVDGIHEEGTPQPIGAEVLIRWNHPMRGLVSPAEFIPLAEETGLILPIGQWVLDTACAQIKTWEQHIPTQGFVLAVNVSAKQFRQVDFVDQVKALVKHHDINPGLLKLELTESLLLDNIDATIVTMSALKDIGIQFSLDDFGTGYSSLQYLKRLPLDQVKIDQSFVRDIVFDANDRAIVKTIIGMARSLNLNYIAEGVETEEQSQLLFDMGCSHYQGYLYGKPMPIEQFDAILQVA